MSGHSSSHAARNVVKTGKDIALLSLVLGWLSVLQCARVWMSGKPRWWLHLHDDSWTNDLKRLPTTLQAQWNNGNPVKSRLGALASVFALRLFLQQLKIKKFWKVLLQCILLLTAALACDFCPVKFWMPSRPVTACISETVQYTCRTKVILWRPNRKLPRPTRAFDWY